MAITATTTTVAINQYQSNIMLTSTTGVTGFEPATGSGQTYLYVGNEMMRVISVPVSGRATVERGTMGTQAVAHITGSVVLAGAPSDFPFFTPEVGAFQAKQLNRFTGVYAPVVAAATIVAPGSLFHVTGATATNIITPPANFVEGPITIIADGAWSWTSTTTANGIAQAGAVTSAGEAVNFYYDATTTYWYSDRRA